MSLKRVRFPIIGVLTALLVAPAAQAQAPATPTVSQPVASARNPMGLLMRSDVQREIRLDLRQRNALAQLQQEMQTERRQRMIEFLREQRGEGPGDRRERMQQMREQMRERNLAIVGELSEKVKAILKPEQVERLDQLDLQWRGPSALADARVAQQVGLGAAARGEVSRIVSEAARHRSEVMRELLEQWRQAGGPQVGPPPTEETAPLATRRALAAIQKESDGQVLAVLTPEEARRWREIQGEPFTFRRDTQQNRLR